MQIGRSLGLSLIITSFLCGCGLAAPRSKMDNEVEVEEAIAQLESSNWNEVKAALIDLTTALKSPKWKEVANVLEATCGLRPEAVNTPKCGPVLRVYYDNYVTVIMAIRGDPPSGYRGNRYNYEKTEADTVVSEWSDSVRTDLLERCKKAHLAEKEQGEGQTEKVTTLVLVLTNRRCFVFAGRRRRMRNNGTGRR